MAEAMEDNKALARARQSVPKALELPPIRLSEPATEFIDNRIGIEDHRAFSSTHISPRSAALAARSISSPAILQPMPTANVADIITLYRDLDVHRQQFLDALAVFESSLPEKYQTKFDVRGKHTWEEVIQEVRYAEEKYKKKASDESAFSKVRGAFRMLEGRAASFETFLELIPSQNNYASPIAGSFKLIIRASTRMNEIRDFIFSTLASIPQEIERAQLVLEFNQDLGLSPRLHKQISELYISILKVIDHVLNWIKQKSGIKHLKALVQQGSYEKELENKLSEFKRQVSLVKDEGEPQFSSGTDALRMLPETYAC